MFSFFEQIVSQLKHFFSYYLRDTKISPNLCHVYNVAVGLEKQNNKVFIKTVFSHQCIEDFLNSFKMNITTKANMFPKIPRTKITKQMAEKETSLLLLVSIAEKLQIETNFHILYAEQLIYLKT